MTFYKSLFYFIRRFYLKHGEAKLAGLFAIGLMSTILFLNIVSLGIILLHFLFRVDLSRIVTGYIGGIPILILLIGNYFYFYILKNKERAVPLFDAMEPLKLNRLKKIVSIYLILSIVVMVVSMIFYFK